MIYAQQFDPIWCFDRCPCRHNFRSAKNVVAILQCERVCQCFQFVKFQREIEHYWITITIKGILRSCCMAFSDVRGHVGMNKAWKLQHSCSVWKAEGLTMARPRQEHQSRRKGLWLLERARAKRRQHRSNSLVR